MKTDTRAMTVATALFFMVGFLTCLNDIVSPHLKSIFALDYAQTQSIPFFFFSSYFVFSYPAGKIVERFGYKKSMVVGLFVMALGALGFLPAAHLATFALFLAALVILAAGMTVVQVAINPYVTVIGPAATASSRLNLAQALESSIRIQVLREIIGSGGRLSKTALADRYNDDRLVRLRLSRLLNAEAIVERDGYLFVVSKPLVALARIFRLLKVLVTGRSSEFIPRGRNLN